MLKGVAPAALARQRTHNCRHWRAQSACHPRVVGERHWLRLVGLASPVLFTAGQSAQASLGQINAQRTVSLAGEHTDRGMRQERAFQLVVLHSVSDQYGGGAANTIPTPPAPFVLRVKGTATVF